MKTTHMLVAEFVDPPPTVADVPFACTHARTHGQKDTFYLHACSLIDDTRHSRTHSLAGWLAGVVHALTALRWPPATVADSAVTSLANPPPIVPYNMVTLLA